ncbi:MAG: ABC transporter ATP-binding protein [Propionibacteriaceae bacterium]|nr:ABC transporter ATP-binding protein [Propionibacteriaceae bacterium]
MTQLRVPAKVSALPGSVGAPAEGSAGAFLRWFLWQQRAYVGLSVLIGLLWAVPGAISPYLLGRVIDEGVVPGSWDAALAWAGLLTVVVLVGVAGGILAHTVEVLEWIQASYRTMTLLGRVSSQLGHVQQRRTPTGEALSVASSDANTFGRFCMRVSNAAAALVAFLLVALIVLNESVVLGVAVLVATPLIVALTGPLMKPLHAATAVERSRSSRLTGMATDIVAGLRILRGIGGERTFGGNYAAQSQLLRAASVKAGVWRAGVESLSGFLTGVLLVALTYLGANELIAGRLSVGQLVAFFGYAVFLAIPVQDFFALGLSLVATLVAAERTSRVLNDPSPWPDSPAESLPESGELCDLATGFTAEPGELTMVVCATPDASAALADRLGRYLPPLAQAPGALGEKDAGRQSRKARAQRRAARVAAARRDADLARAAWGVELGGVDLARVPLAEVRDRILVSDTGASLFDGTLQQAIDPHGRATRAQAEAALYAAAAEDVLEGLPGGWQGGLGERGRSLSGGQRQRVILARALLADPEILVLVEPTSAVDAHTEARIASRLAEARRGRTTVVMTASPLLLRHADRVALLDGGEVAARGSHAELFATCAAYREVVRRGMAADE